jgi:hypothetical protein
MARSLQELGKRGQEERMVVTKEGPVVWGDLLGRGGKFRE